MHKRPTITVVFICLYLVCFQGTPSTALAKCNAFEYAVSCHSRAVKQWGMTRANDSEKKGFLLALLHALAKYIRLMLQHPSLFPDPKLQAGSTGPYIVGLMRKDMRDDSRLSGNLLESIVATTNGGGGGVEVDDVDAVTLQLRRDLFSPVVGQLYREASGDPFRLGSFTLHLGPLVQLASNKDLAHVILQSRNWLPVCNTARELQTRSFLGPFFSYSVCPQQGQKPGSEHFGNVEQPHLTPDVNATMVYIRKSINSYHLSLHSLIMDLLTIKAMRTRVVDWFAQAIDLNKQRTQDRHFNAALGARAPDDPSLCTDGFAVNLSSVMIKMCEPISHFTADQPPKFDKLDSAYLLRRGNAHDSSVAGPRVRIDGPPLVDASLVTAAADGNKLTKDPNFATECFYLTLSCLHIALVPTVRLYYRSFCEPHRCAYQRDLREHHRIENLRLRSPLSPQQLQMLTLLKQRVKTQTQDMFCLMTQLHDQAFTLPVINFYVFVCSWLLHLADPDGKGLPLSDSVPAQFAAIPEYVVSDTAYFLTFISKLEPEHLEMLPAEKVAVVAKFYAVFIGNETYMKQMHLRTEFINVLAAYTPERRKGKQSAFFNMFLNEPTSQEHFAPALFNFFVHLQAEDEYALHTNRNHVAVIMKNLWKSEPHRAAIVKQSSTSLLFDKWLLMIINDTVDLFDQGRLKLEEVLKTKATINSPNFATLTPQEQRQENQNLQQQEGTAKYLFECGCELVEAFVYLSTEGSICKKFSGPALVSRFAAMLNFNTKDMVSSSDFTELDYKNYGLDRVRVLSLFIRIYVQVAFQYTDASTTWANKTTDKSSCIAIAVSKDLYKGKFDGSVYREAARCVGGKRRCFAGCARGCALVFNDC